MHRRLSRVWGFLGAASLLALGGITTATVPAAAQSGPNVSWVNPDNNLQGWRYSPLTQINTGNVAHLKVAWRFTTTVQGANEDHPTIVGNTAYVVTAFNHVFALNATTGKEIWSYVPKEGPQVACCGPDARGLAYHDGTIYMVTLDDQFIALNAQTGAVKYDVRVQSYKNGVAETASPLYYNGLVYLGSSGSELGIRGFEEARYASNGKLAWIFYTTPPRSESWVKTNHGIAGGSVWNNPVIDTATNTIYIGTANPAPLLYALNRPGPDHWTDSVVALNARTGKMKWGFQTTPHDMWDYDNSSNPILFPTPIGMGVGEAGKSGVWSEFDAKTGEQITTPVAFAMANHAVQPPVGGRAVTVSPSPLGGDPWSPTAFSPKTDLVYVEGDNSTTKLTGSPKGDVFVKGKDLTFIGSTFSNLKVHGSNLTAINPGSGTIVWQYNNHAPYIAEGGPTVTAGNLVFTAQSQLGDFFALNAKTGKLLWTGHPDGAIGGGASVYMVNGKEYILVPLGGGGGSPPTGKLPKYDAYVAYTLGS